MSTCPSEATLQRLAAADLGDLTFVQVEQHVESCARCKEFLQALICDEHRGPARDIVPLLADLPEIRGFQIQRELGRGSNSAVFLAEDERTGRPVAFKVVRTVDPPAGEPRRLTEEEAISKLRHPNILQLYQVIEAGTWTVLVLEFIPGGSLKERLAAPLSAHEAAQAIETIARAIGHVHRQGLLHLDIKPSNVLVDGESGSPLAAAHLKVSDFGISLPLADSPAGPTGPPAIRGTPSYMAPEQAGAIDTPIGPATDVYALGALLYHMLAGRAPFQSAAASQTLRLIGTVDPVPPGQLRPGIPKDLEAICLHCLEKHPIRRYASADALADELRRFLDGRRISIRPASIEQLSRWCRRRPEFAGVLFSLVCTVIASITALAYLLHQARTERALAIDAREKAEQNEAIASRTLEEFDVWVQRILDEPDLLEGNQLPTLVGDVQRLTEQLHTDQESVLRMTATVSLLERHLARNLQFARDRDGLPEATALLARSRRHLADCLHRKPDAPALREQYLLTLLDCAEAAYSLASSHAIENRLADFHVLDSCLVEVAEIAPTILSRNLRVAALCQVSKLRFNVAFDLRISSNPEAVRRLMATNLQMLQQAMRDDAETPDLRFQTALTLSWLDRTDEAIPSLRELRALTPSNWLSFREIDQVFHRWLALQVAGQILWPEKQAIDFESEGRSIVELVRSRASAVGITPPVPASVVDRISTLVQLGCAGERQQNKVEREFGSAQRFLAFAHQLTQAYPDRADAHMLVAQAYHQLAKNAWHFDEDRTALSQMDEAVAAARRAAAIDPDSPAAAHLLVDLERRLAKSGDARHSPN